MVKNIISVLTKVSKIESPQNKALLEIFAIFKNEYGIDL